MPSQHTTPIIVGPDDSAESLQPTSAEYSEEWLQNLLFKHPEALPIDEIDRTFTPAIPICTELRTPAGSIDALLATPKGRLIILETKLWRNPEARRKVVGQILDYAKELSRCTYSDLQREVSKRTERSGNALFEIVAATETPDCLAEAEFVDEVSRSLRHGRFLLLICGDGIREDVAAITDFLQRQGTLHFTFGLVEVAMYDMPEERRLVQPRILAQSAIVKRTVVSLESEGLVAEDEEGEENEAELGTAERFYLEFWKEFIKDLELDDPDQPPPIPTKHGFTSFEMPAPKVKVYLEFYIKNCGVGIYLWAPGNFGERVFEQLLEDREEIEKDIGVPVKWSTDDPEDSNRWIESRKRLPDNPKDTTYRSEIKEFFVDRANRFVNVFRPRIKRIMENLEE